ncbi:MAG: hypothetical protein NVSMB3_08560 [Acidobacteriaceae bacterium]
MQRPAETSELEAARVGVLTAVLLNLGLLYHARGETKPARQTIAWCYSLVRGDPTARAQAIAGQCKDLLDEMQRGEAPGPPAATLKLFKG